MVIILIGIYIKRTSLRITDKSYEDIKALQSAEGKVLFGAV